MDLWNVKNLEPPPINSAKADIKEIDVKFLSNVLKDGVEFFKNQPYLCSEAAVLSRTIYRLKMKFRSSKDFKAMEKLSRALRAYLEVGIAKVLKTFLDSVPEIYKANKTYLPTKHMMDFVLVRMQGLGKILIRILETCKIVCQLCQQRLGLGHFWNIALITYGMAARIFVIVKNVIKYTCELYSNLVPYSAKLKSIGKQWLPDGYVVPRNLSDWLEIDWVDLETTVIEIVDEKPEPDMFFFNLVEDSDDDVEVCDEYILVKDEPSSYQIKKPLKEETVELSDNDVDIGEIINLSDAEMSQVSNKENLRTQNGTLFGFDGNVDIGEVVNVSPKTAELVPENSRKRKRGKNVLSQTSTEVVNLSNIGTPTLKTPVKKKKAFSQSSSEVINLSNIETPLVKTGTKKKKISHDTIEIIDSRQQKIIGKKRVQSPTPTEVIEITDNSEIVVLSDIETPKAPLQKGKKRKAKRKNAEFEFFESGFTVASLNPSKKRKKMKAGDSKKLLQLNQNINKSKKKKKLGKVLAGSGGTNLAKPKNITLKVNAARKNFKKKKFTLKHTQLMSSEGKKRKKKKKR